MTCYFRHLQIVFKKAGIEVTILNKRELDRIIHEIVRVKYKNCPNTWNEVKRRIVADEESFAVELKKRMEQAPLGRSVRAKVTRFCEASILFFSIGTDAWTRF